MNKGFVESKVLDKKMGNGNDDIVILELSNTLGIIPKPGQFIALRPSYQPSVMPRPFSVIWADDEWVFVAIKNAGKNTAIYQGLDVGDTIRISGPRGKPFSLLPFKKYLLVGGSIGAAGLLWPATKAKDADIRVCLGGRRKKDIFGAEMFKDGLGAKNVITIVEEGENGGTVVDLLKKELQNDGGESIIVACGPTPMLRAVAELAKKHKNECHVSMEEMMSCGGKGSCVSDVVFLTDGTTKKVCKDGPIIDTNLIDWEKTLPAPKKVSFKKSPKTDKPMRIILKGKEGRKLTLNYPTMTASGCFGIEEAEESSLDFIGALVVKSIKKQETIGNATPRVCETASGMINSIGLQNIGIKRFLNEELERWLALGLPVFVSIAGETVAEFGELALLLADTDIAGIQANVSCLNVHRGMLPFGVEPKDVYGVTDVVRKNAPHKLIDVKLTPNVTDVTPQAQAADEGGADFISLVNTFPATDIDVWSAIPKIANGFGGLSGPAILPQALHKVQQAVKAVKIPVIGMGGIRNGEDAAKFLMLGASAIAAGTGNFSGNVFADINDDITKIMKHHNVNQVKDIIGCIKI